MTVFHPTSDAELASCFPAFLALRPHLDLEGFLQQVRRQQAQGYRILALMCVHVDDFLFGYDESCEEGKRLYKVIQALYRWGSWSVSEAVSLAYGYASWRTIRSRSIWRSTLERVLATLCFRKSAKNRSWPSAVVARWASSLSAI